MQKGNIFKGEIYNKYLKRLIDITASIILLIIFAPIILFVIIAIKFNSKGPVFADIPPRVGKEKKRFRMYKFRSMIQNAHRILREDPKFRKLYEEYKKSSYKLHNDPRITSVGRFIRKHSLDELPQLFNVLRGEMSIVGPRAYYPDEISDQIRKYPGSQKYMNIVLCVRPGITGYWQVYGRSEVHFYERVKMDAQYVKKISLWYDIKIMLLTPWAMISGKGAV